MAKVGNQDGQSQSVLDSIGGTIPAISMAIAEGRLGKIASLLVLALGQKVAHTLNAGKVD